MEPAPPGRVVADRDEQRAHREQAEEQPGQHARPLEQEIVPGRRQAGEEERDDEDDGDQRAQDAEPADLPPAEVRLQYHTEHRELQNQNAGGHASTVAKNPENQIGPRVGRRVEIALHPPTGSSGDGQPEVKDPVAAFGDFRVVGGQDDGATASGHPEHAAPATTARAGLVELGGGLVGDQQPGLRARARATATRCCWPPDSSSTIWPACGPSPRSSRRVAAAVWASGAGSPAALSATSMFSAAVSSETRP